MSVSPSLWRSAFLTLVLLAGAAGAQERFSIFVGSDPSNVERMLRLAQLRDDDVVTDLGSGDGRIVIGAALLNAKLRGIGVDIDAKLVQQATAEAAGKGVGERVSFVHQNAFDADLSGVSVIFMWLWPEIQVMLRPKILAEARPGTRVVTNVWDLGSWQPDQVDQDGPPVSLWIVPARIEGYWSWELPIRGRAHAFSTILEQRFQRAEGFTRVGNRRGVFREVKLRGEDISVSLEMTLEGAGYTRQEYSGKVKGDTIEGSVTVTLPVTKDQPVEEKVVLPWRATRARSTAYLAPTGLNAP
jgi:hypothetical protein